MNFFINLEEVLKNIDGIVWGPPLLILLVGTGIYFTFKLNFIQMFKLPLAIKYLFLMMMIKAIMKQRERYQVLQHYVQHYQLL